MSAPPRRSASGVAVAWRRFRRNKSGIAGAAIIAVFVFMGLWGTFAAPYPARSYACILNGCANLPPFVNWAHPLGTENSGIDIFSEILHSTFNDMYVGLGATAIALAIGLVVGGLAGYRGGALSSVLFGITQAVLVIPLLILILVFAKLGQTLVGEGFGLTLIMLILGLFGWPGIAYIVRGEILRVKEYEFIQAEKGLGASTNRILFRHIIPNIMSPLVVFASLAIAGNILTEVVISFLGFGSPSTSTWGLLLQEGFDVLRTQWWVSVFPGLAVVFCVLGFNLLGDGLSDALNPRLRE